MRVALEPVWTYDATQLLTTPLYQVRRLIGDVITTDQQLGDAEILFALANRPSIYGAGADCCRDIAAQYSRKVDVITAGAGGSLKTNYSAQSKAYLDMAIRLDTMAITRSGTVPYAGGISIADKQVNEQDTDRVAPQFNIGMEDNQIFGGPIGNELADASSEDDSCND
jgi:hypothetical protein